MEDHRPTDEPTDRRSVDERRGELLDAAIEILAAGGLARTTTRAVTERAGLALGAFHYAFRSKDELLTSVLDRLDDHRLAVLLDASRSRKDDLGACLVSMLEAAWDSVEHSPTMHLAALELTVTALRETSLRDAVKAGNARSVFAIVQALQDVRGAPKGMELEDLARLLLATVDGLTLQALIEDDEDAARRRLRIESKAFERLGHRVTNGAA